MLQMTGRRELSVERNQSHTPRQSISHATARCLHALHRVAAQEELRQSVQPGYTPVAKPLPLSPELTEVSSRPRAATWLVPDSGTPPY